MSASPDSDQAWLARGSFDLGGDALAWVDRRIIDIPVRVASVVLTEPDGNGVVLARSSADQPFAIDGLPAEAKPKPDDACRAGRRARSARPRRRQAGGRAADPEDGVARARSPHLTGLSSGCGCRRLTRAIGWRST